MSSPAPAPIPESDRIPTKEKLAFGAGGISGALQGNVDNNLLNPVFVVLLGVSPALMSVLGSLYRIWDAASDMFTGWLSDNTRSRWGRRRPYLIVGAMLCALWMPVIWLFDRSWDLHTIVIWMVVAQLGLFLFSSIWNIPYQSLLLEMTPHTVERTNVAVVRQYVSTVAWLGMGWTWYLTQLPVFNDAEGKPDIITGALWITVVAAVLVVIFGVLPGIFCKERYYHTVAKAEKVPLWKNIRLTFVNKPFLILAAITLLFVMGTQAKTGLAFYSRLYYVCGGDQKLAATIGGWENTIVLVIGVLGIPVFQWFARRHGKRAAVGAIMVIILFASLSTYFTYTPEHPYLSMVSGILLAPTGSAIWVLIPSMTGDIVDHDELSTRERREGAFASMFSWILKLAFSLATAVSGVLVELAGFDAKLSIHQPDAVLWSMRLLLIVVPAVFIGGAILLSFFYPLTTRRVVEIRAELENRRGAV